MLTRKHTAWKKNRKFGDVFGGRKRPKLADNYFKRLHSLTPLKPGDAKPVYIVDNPSRDFYFPVTIDEIEQVIFKLPEEHTQHLTHIWLQKIKKSEYLNGETFQGCFICGGGINLIVLNPFPIDNKMRFGHDKPVKRILNFYKDFCTDLDHDKEGWFLQWTEDKIKRYYLESLLLHEIGHSIDSFYKRFWSKTADKRNEDFADNYAVIWANTIRETYTENE